MSLSPDHQLGLDLRARRPTGEVGAKVLESMLRDLVGTDQSLIPPLLDLVARPSFLALDPNQAPAAERRRARQQLLAELGPVYVPGVLERLKDFLDGYLDHGDLAAPPPTEAPASGRSRSARQTALVVGAAALIGAAALGLASTGPQLCRQLGWCGRPSSPGTGTTAADLDAAARAATALAAAPDLPSLERALADLERPLQRLQGAGLSGDQIRRRDQLQSQAREGRERLERERSQPAVLTEPQPQPAAAEAPAAPVPARPQTAPPARRPVASSSPRPAARPRPAAPIEREGGFKPVMPMESEGASKPVVPLDQNDGNGGGAI